MSRPTSCHGLGAHMGFSTQVTMFGPLDLGFFKDPSLSTELAASQLTQTQPNKTLNDWKQAGHGRSL